MCNNSRMVYAISDWPEDFGVPFVVTSVHPDETDEQAIERAKELYSDDLKFYIE